MTNYSEHYSKKKTSQSESIPDKEMIKNNAGGYSFEVSLEQKFKRFLILGTEGGSYYVRERELTIENAKATSEFIELNGKKAVDIIVEISSEGRAYKNDPALYALAIAISSSNEETRTYALNSISKVARIGTHLFHFLKFAKGFRGWGRGIRRAISDWYLMKDNKSLAYQSIKYQQRDGWSHCDALRLSHPKTTDKEKNAIFKWITHKEMPTNIEGEGLKLIQAFESTKTADKKKIIELIKEYNLPREAIPTEYLADPDVWKVLLDDIGITALIRNLANLTRINLLSLSNTDIIDKVENQITDEEILKKGRIHPIQILAALMTYQHGHGRREGEWIPITKIIDALDESFYKTFKIVEPTNKRILMAVDVSGSMTTGTLCSVPGLTPRVASAALSLITANIEKNCTFMAFCDKFIPLDISPNRRLDDVIETMSYLSFGGTDCALPMIWALENKIPIDAFIVLTDSETWFGDIHPMQALDEYRRKMNIPDAKLIVVGMVANRLTIADPEDRNCLDIVGFDTATPQMISEFIKGNI